MLDESKERERPKEPLPVASLRRDQPEERVPDTYEEMAKAKRGSLFGRVNQAFQDVLQSSRGTTSMRAPAKEAGEDPRVSADDLAIRRARSVKLQRMTVPEGVIIDGSMASGSETEIAGRIEGDVTVDGRLTLDSSALISGNVRAVWCRTDGLVEGKLECSKDIELGPTGRLNGDVVVGKRMNVAGQVFGNIASAGLVRLTATARVTGDIRARGLVIEEGALFNGTCLMRPSSQRGDKR